MKRLLLLLIFLFIGSIFLIGCSQEAAVDEPTGVDEPLEEETEELDEEEVFSNIYPLTGIGTNKDIDHRAVAVTVNNDPAARPQSGVNEADIVYEVLAEGGIVTRFLAIFHSQKPENIGPVRSARGYLIELTNGYDAFFVTHGWSPEAHNMLENQKKAPYLQGLYYDGIYFKRYNGRKAPHNSYITFENIEAGLESRGYDLKGHVTSHSFLTSDEIEELEGTEALEVSVKYNSHTVSYEYDKDEQKYVRSSGGEPTVDYETEEPVAVENLFVVATKHTVVDNEGRLNIDLTSGGDGFLFQNGIMQEVEWENVNGRILPTIRGEVVKYIPGQTWVNIIQSVNDVSITQEEEEA